ncbi:hypothetical protein MARPU_14035 [Marichromatium purpuratum 984]|uniref:Uncharacterized protein n=1 Tax=Marichromatium purpuratum 984 TaxID=765910 RepID=W0E426_MARPU|nr:hypothetical protein MARPU_14035 [Marichromatium purpuratum 984]
MTEVPMFSYSFEMPCSRCLVPLLLGRWVSVDLRSL